MVSPARSLVPMSASDRSATRSSSARPKTRARGSALQQLLQDHDFALTLALPGQDDVERLVEDDLIATPELRQVDVGMEGHPHLAAAREDVDGSVVVGAEVGPVRRRWLGQLLDFVAEVRDVLLGRLEGEGELLVLGHGLGQLTLGLEELLLQGLHPARALLEPAAEDGDLLFGGQRPGTERLEILFVGRLSLAVGIVEINRCNHLNRAVGTPFRPYTGGTPEPTTPSPAGADRRGWPPVRVTVCRCSGCSG